MIAPQLLLIPCVAHQSGYAMFFNTVKVDLARFLSRTFFIVLDARDTEGYASWEDRL
jgi:hypothetical protein